MLAGILDSLPTRGDGAVFVGADRIGGDEFAELVWSYAGGLRARGERSIALVGAPGPTMVAMVLAAVGTGTRVDWIDPRAGDELVRARLEASGARLTVADGALAWPLKGPKWLRDRMGLPKYDVWPQIVPVDHVGGAQKRRFALDDDAAALTLFPRGRREEPLGAVHTVGSLSAGVGGVAALLGVEGPVLTDSLVVMLAAVALGRPVLRASSRARLLAWQVRRHGSGTIALRDWRRLGDAPRGARVLVGGEEPAPADAVVSLLSSGVRVTNVYALPDLFPVAASVDGGALELVDGVSARTADDGELLLGGAAMAPRFVEGPYRDEVATGRHGAVEGRRLSLGERRT